ncbi:MAG: DUF937 domain-containing protein [Janthinobacterium lividum]
MSQQLLDLINRFGGEDAVAAMAARVGLSPEQTQSAMAALMPAVAGGMAKHVEANGPAGLDAAAGQAAAITSGGAVASDAAVEHGTNILGSLFGSSQVTDAVTGHAAAATGLDASKLAALLPMIATLAAGALGHAGGQAPAEGGGLGGMLGGLLGQVTGGTGGAAPATGAAGTLMSMLDFNKDGNVMDDIMGVVGKLRGH